MTTSILNDVKHNLGLYPEDTAFDSDIKMHINSAFARLTSLGVGPIVGYSVTGPEDLWSAFYNDPRLNAVQSYVYLSVKMLFQPPETGFATTAMAEQKKEMEFVLNVMAETG